MDPHDFTSQKRTIRVVDLSLCSMPGDKTKSSRHHSCCGIQPQKLWL